MSYSELRRWSLENKGRNGDVGCFWRWAHKDGGRNGMGCCVNDEYNGGVEESDLCEV